MVIVNCLLEIVDWGGRELLREMVILWGFCAGGR